MVMADSLAQLIYVSLSVQKARHVKLYVKNLKPDILIAISVLHFFFPMSVILYEN